MCDTFLVTCALPFFKKSDTYSWAWLGHFLLALVNPFTARKDQRSFKVILTLESVDKILWCDHSNETF